MTFNHSMLYCQLSMMVRYWISIHGLVVLLFSNYWTSCYVVFCTFTFTHFYVYFCTFTFTHFCVYFLYLKEVLFLLNQFVTFKM